MLYSIDIYILFLEKILGMIFLHFCSKCRFPRYTTISAIFAETLQRGKFVTLPYKLYLESFSILLIFSLGDAGSLDANQYGQGVVPYHCL